MTEALKAIKLVLDSGVELSEDAKHALSVLVETACYYLCEDVFGHELEDDPAEWPELTDEQIAALADDVADEGEAD